VIGVVDTIRSIKPDVQTVALGAVHSYSSLILVWGG
jgi:ATP-dependent Clp protease protease subunit